MYECVYLKCAIIDEISSYIRFSGLISNLTTLVIPRQSSPLLTNKIDFVCPSLSLSRALCIFFCNFRCDCMNVFSVIYIEIQCAVQHASCTPICSGLNELLYFHPSIVKFCWCSHIYNSSNKRRSFLRTFAHQNNSSQ